jgi:transcriptional regulator with XRE-family HTH domain
MRAATLIGAARRAAGLSLRELARRASTSPSAMVAYEHGTRDPTLDTLVRLVEASGHALRVELQEATSPPRAGVDPWRAADELEQALALAELLPTRHRRELPYPVFGRAAPA